MKKRIVSLALALAIMLIALPTYAGTFTIPTRRVYGDDSQTVCTVSASHTNYATLNVDTITLLYNQKHITFRTYYNGSPLMTNGVNVKTANTYTLTYDLGSVSVGNKVKLKASIPSTNANYYCEFSGSVVI